MNKQLIEAAQELNVTFKIARKQDRHKIGRHLANPCERELWDALEMECRDNCGMPSIIYIHQVDKF